MIKARNAGRSNADYSMTMLTSLGPICCACDNVFKGCIVNPLLCSRWTYSRPAPNNIYSEIFFPRFICNFLSIGKGIARIATSVAILMAAFAYATPDMLRQRDLSLKPSCHVAWIGLHCHITMGMRMNEHWNRERSHAEKHRNAEDLVRKYSEI
jgi:hypothetical protein